MRTSTYLNAYVLRSGRQLAVREVRHRHESRMQHSRSRPSGWGRQCSPDRESNFQRQRTFTLTWAW